MHLMRAESPGPSVGKFVPKVRETAKILYAIYIVMTLVEIILLLFAGMPLFDSLTVSFGTAGTGGFGIKNASIADYNMVIQAIISIFMILFGVNFGAYFLLLGNNKKDAFKLEEVHWYLMTADNYHSRPQREEFFVDSGYYKFYEAYHLLKFSNEKQILEKAYNEYLDLKKANLWGSKKYF